MTSKKYLINRSGVLCLHQIARGNTYLVRFTGVAVQVGKERTPVTRLQPQDLFFCSR